jgi:predicted amidohydrolase
MLNIRVAAVSMNGFLGEPERVLAAIAYWCERAASENANLVLFPELVIHGHCTPNTWDLAEPVPDGPGVHRLSELARRHRLFLSAGLSEKEREIVYNTQVLVGPDGFIGKQRKLHLSNDETLHYQGGRDIQVYDVGLCKIGIVICYDNQFPEVPRISALRGADVLLMPHAARFKLWEDTAESEAAARGVAHSYYRGYALRARENACFAVVADQAGRAGYNDMYLNNNPQQPHHPGGAFIFGPDGGVLACTQSQQIREEMVVATLDPALLARQRSLPNYTLRTRRPELFGELVRE